VSGQSKSRNFVKKAKASLFTFVLLVGSASLPATAAEDSWTLEVNVSDTSCADPITEASWSPDSSVTYIASNEVDLDPFAPNAAGLIPFDIGLGLTPGYDPCTTWNVDVTGDVEAWVTSLDAELSMEEMDCSPSTLVTTPVCDAYLLYLNNNSIAGTIDASAVTTTGLKTGSLTVVWTPAD
jgi:hypothetical protein